MFKMRDEKPAAQQFSEDYHATLKSYGWIPGKKKDGWTHYTHPHYPNQRIEAHDSAGWNHMRGDTWNVEKKGKTIEEHLRSTGGSSQHSEEQDSSGSKHHEALTKEGFKLTNQGSGKGKYVWVQHYTHSDGRKKSIAFHSDKGHGKVLEGHQFSEQTTSFQPTSFGILGPAVQFREEVEQFNEDDETHKGFLKAYPKATHSHGTFKGDQRVIGDFHAIVKKHGGEMFDHEKFAIPHSKVEDFHDHMAWSHPYKMGRRHYNTH